MSRLWRAIRLWWLFRRLRKAHKVIRATDALMPAGTPRWKRQQFWADFIKREDFRDFASSQIAFGGKV